MIIEALGQFLKQHYIKAPVAVAVSGGPDSMALGYVLTQYVPASDIHVLSVHHGLRPEAGGEIEMVRAQALEWGARFEALHWAHDGVSTRVQEEARRARYELMEAYCKTHGIGFLFLGHHMDDQAETVLFRLAKGSGLDGLCGMQVVQAFDGEIKLCRPFLEVAKADLVEFCEAHQLSYVRDPSNENTDYVRGRLRQSRAVLEKEGLSAKRLMVTAKRLTRARLALDDLSEKAFKECVIFKDTIRIEFLFKLLKLWPDEVILRVVVKAMTLLRGQSDYLPRFEKIEAVFGDVIAQAPFRKRTLGGVVFERDDVQGRLILSKENAV